LDKNQKTVNAVRLFFNQGGEEGWGGRARKRKEALKSVFKSQRNVLRTEKVFREKGKVTIGKRWMELSKKERTAKLINLILKGEKVNGVELH